MSYGKIEQCFFKLREVKALTFGAKSLLLYYLTCHHRNFIGVYYMPHIYALDDLALSAREHEKYFGELVSHQQVIYDEEEKIIFVPSNLIHNPIKSEKQVTGAKNLLKDVRSRKILQAFLNFVDDNSIKDHISQLTSVLPIPYRYPSDTLSIEVKEEVEEKEKTEETTTEQQTVKREQTITVSPLADVVAATSLNMTGPLEKRSTVNPTMTQDQKRRKYLIDFMTKHPDASSEALNAAKENSFLLHPDIN